MVNARSKALRLPGATGVAATLILLLILAGAAWFLFRTADREEGSSATGSAYERVIRTNRIRAGYVTYPPASIVAPADGAVSGVFPDLLREIGRLTSLEVTFTEEVGYADLLQGLQNGRYDIVGGVWANPNRAKLSTISAPVYYTGVGVWVRVNEDRLLPDNNWESLNRSNIRIAAIDGSTPLNIAREQFPKARLITYPNLTPESQLFLDVVQNRADVFFAEPAQGIRFIESNPGAVKNIAVARPLRVFASVYLMRPSEPQFKTMIDTAISELQSSGRLERILSRYEPAPGVFLRPALPYIPATAQAPQGSNVTR